MFRSFLDIVTGNCCFEDRFCPGRFRFLWVFCVLTVCVILWVALSRPWSKLTTTKRLAVGSSNVYISQRTNRCRFLHGTTQHPFQSTRALLYSCALSMKKLCHFLGTSSSFMQTSMPEERPNMVTQPKDLDGSRIPVDHFCCINLL